MRIFIGDWSSPVLQYRRVAASENFAKGTATLGDLSCVCRRPPVRLSVLASALKKGESSVFTRYAFHYRVYRILRLPRLPEAPKRFL